MNQETTEKQDQPVNDEHASPGGDVQFFDAWNERLKLDFDQIPTEFEF